MSNDSIAQTGHRPKVKSRITKTHTQYVLLCDSGDVLGRWPKCRAGANTVLLAQIKTASEKLYRATLQRVTKADSPDVARSILLGTRDYLIGRNTELASEIEAWLATQATEVQLTMAVRKYGWGTTTSMNDPVIWLHKLGEDRHTYQMGKRPSYFNIDKQLMDMGYVPITDGPVFKAVEAQQDMTIRRYRLEIF